MQMQRLFETVYILLERRSITARELAERFEVSTRTIYRDLDTLSAAGIPLYTNKGKGGGISLMEHYVLNKSLLSKQEQDNILSSLISMKHLSNENMDDVITKLGSIFQKSSIDWIDVDFSDWSRNEDHKKFTLIKDAIWNCHYLQFDYTGTNGISAVRKVEPLKLLFKSQAWYLFAYDAAKQDTRFFKLARIQHISVEEQTFQRKNLEPSYEHYEKLERAYCDLKLKFHPSYAFRVYDEFSSETITKDTSGYLLVSVTMLEEQHLYDYLMSFGDGVEVLHPKEKRREMKQRLQRACKLYE